jgi:hypothetical protein
MRNAEFWTTEDFTTIDAAITAGNQAMQAAAQEG